MEVQVLDDVQLEAPLAAVPVAVENHRVALDHVQPSVGVEAGVDLEGAPVERPRGGRRRQGEEERQG
jgi:hypothetical protein